MIQKTTETLTQTIARLHDEATRANNSLVFEKTGGGTYWAGGDIVLHADAIEFTDDEGVHVVVPYNHLIAVEIRADRG